MHSEEECEVSDTNNDDELDGASDDVEVLYAEIF